MSVEGEGGSGDKTQLLGIFSTEVWLLILENVKNAADFQRISNASPYLGNLLQPRAAQVLFPEVLQILTQQQPPLFTSPGELLSLREVCHAWKSGVEQLLEDPEHHFLFERELWEKRHLMKSNPTDGARVHTVHFFAAVEDFTKFRQHFNPAQAATHSRNPLFCREVYLDFPEELRDFPAYFEACLEFLQTYGTHVWHCFIVPYLLDLERHQEFYSVALKQLLALMPNLKMLYFNDISLNDADFVMEGAPMLQSVAVTPVPELKQLQMIRVNGVLLSFLRALLQRNPQVSIVSDVSDTPKENDVPLYLEQMPNLAALELKLNHLREFAAFREASVNCPLNKLHLFVGWGKDERKPSLALMFRVLEAHFSATLTELNLQFHCKVDSTEKDLKLQLPHLQKLSVTFQDQWISLDFALPLKDTLEQLVVGVSYSFGFPFLPYMQEVEEEEDRTIKLYQFWTEPQKSNAWVLFPKLKLLATATTHGGKVHSCTRDEWLSKRPK